MTPRLEQREREVEREKERERERGRKREVEREREREREVERERERERDDTYTLCSDAVTLTADYSSRLQPPAQHHWFGCHGDCYYNISTPEGIGE